MTSEERRAQNEAIFRDANEQIEAARRRLNVAARTPYFCECDRVECRESVLLTPEEYEDVRSNPATFVIVPGHPHDGATVDERDGYTVVEKTGLGKKVALETDPRSADG
jgi:hypothetical protein